MHRSTDMVLQDNQPWPLLFCLLHFSPQGFFIKRNYVNRKQSSFCSTNRKLISFFFFYLMISVWWFYKYYSLSYYRSEKCIRVAMQLLWRLLAFITYLYFEEYNFLYEERKCHRIFPDAVTDLPKFDI